jgi:hypothetical protein
MAVLNNRELLRSDHTFSLEVRHEGEVVGSPRLVVVRVVNTGTQPIEAAEFERAAHT